jgi:2Fe-2S ferredoxin
MAKIHYRLADGTTRTLDVRTGMSVMEGAIQHGVPGIDAECGGSCNCATCRVDVDDGWRARLPAAGVLERDMLDAADIHAPGARLSCQIKVTEALDGLVVQVPATQE